MTFWKDGAPDHGTVNKRNSRKSMPRPSSKGMAPDWQIQGRNLITGFKTPGTFIEGHYYGEWGELHKD